MVALVLLGPLVTSLVVGCPKTPGLRSTKESLALRRSFGRFGVLRGRLGVDRVRTSAQPVKDVLRITFLWSLLLRGHGRRRPLVKVVVGIQERYARVFRVLSSVEVATGVLHCS